MFTYQQTNIPYRRCSFLGNQIREPYPAKRIYNLENRYEGWFHGWGGTSEYAYGIVELDTGEVVFVFGTGIVFEPIFQEVK